MSDLADLWHFWSSDLQQGPTGDIALAFRADRTSQRIIRRLMTNSGGGDYPWEPDYGAGLPAKIGDTLNIPYLTALIIGQIALEASVARDPAPQVLVTQIQGGAAIQVIYYDQSGQGVPLSFNLFAAAAEPAPRPVPILESVTPPSVHQLPPVEPDKVVLGTTQNPGILVTETAVPIVTETGEEFSIS